MKQHGIMLSPIQSKQRVPRLVPPFVLVYVKRHKQASSRQSQAITILVLKEWWNTKQIVHFFGYLLLVPVMEAKCIVWIKHIHITCHSHSFKIYPIYRKFQQRGHVGPFPTSSKRIDSSTKCVIQSL